MPIIRCTSKLLAAIDDEPVESYATTTWGVGDWYRVTDAKHMIQHQGGPEFCDVLTTTHVLNMTPMKPIGYSNGLEKMRALVAEITEGEVN